MDIEYKSEYKDRDGEQWEKEKHLFQFTAL